MRRGWNWDVLLVWFAVVFAAFALVFSVVTDARATIIGSSGGAEIAQLSADVGHTLPAHRYGQLDGTPITDAHYVNIAFGDWRHISSHEDEVRRWAVALRDTGRTRLVSLDHEPMTDRADGSPRDYVLAARWMTNLMRSVAPNIRIVWTTTWVSIQHGIKGVHAYYPGARWVDYVSTNVFNRPDVRGWQSFPTLVKPLILLGERYGKRLVISEWASDASPKRAHWISVAGNYMAAHRTTFMAAFWYTGAHYAHNRFGLTTQPEFAALAGAIRKAK